MSSFVSLYIATAAVFFVIDFIWLSVMGQRFYAVHMGEIMREKPLMAVAGGFYLVYVVGVVVFAAQPAQGDVVKAALLGGLLGLIAYGTYDLTNLATLKSFPPIVAAVDIVWGTLLTGVSAAAGVFIVNLVRGG